MMGRSFGSAAFYAGVIEASSADSIPESGGITPTRFIIVQATTGSASRYERQKALRVWATPGPGTTRPYTRA